MPIKVAEEFYTRLANRDKNQGDGKNTAVEFRTRFLKECEQESFWTNKKVIELDFEGVKKIGPSFANEAFAFFTSLAKPDVILQRIRILNASVVQMAIIQQELQAGYDRR